MSDANEAKVHSEFIFTLIVVTVGTLAILEDLSGWGTGESYDSRTGVDSLVHIRK